MVRMDEFTLAYFEAALWSSTGDDDEPLDANYGIEDFAPETSEKMIADCANFQERFGSLIEDDDPRESDEYGRWALAGHDFWLTRNGHGAGFWDGDWPKHGDELDKAAHEYGEFDLYVSDDGLIYSSSSGLRESAAQRPVSDRLFMGVYPGGIVYADKSREKDGDYARCAFLSFSTLELQWEKDCPGDLRAEIERDAARIQSMRGQPYPIDASGNTVILGKRPGAREAPRRHMRAPAADMHARTPVDPTAWYFDGGTYDRVIYTSGPYPSRSAAWRAEADFRHRYPDLEWSDVYQGLDMGHPPAPEPPRSSPHKKKAPARKKTSRRRR